MKKAVPFILLALVLALAGCASSPKTDAKNADWSSRIGSYTYEQAVGELGKPDVLSESSEGRTAEWVLRRSPNVSFGFGFGTGSYGHHSGAGVGSWIAADRTARSAAASELPARRAGGTRVLARSASSRFPSGRAARRPLV